MKMARQSLIFYVVHALKNLHSSGWEENKNVVAKKIRQEAKMRRRKKAKKAAQ